MDVSTSNISDIKRNSTIHKERNMLLEIDIHLKLIKVVHTPQVANI